MGKIESQWRQSITRRGALRGLSVLFAGSPLFLQAQQDPHPLRDSRRALGIDEMVTAFDFEPIFHANLPLPIFSYTAHGTDSEFTLRRNREVFDWVEVVTGRGVELSSVDTSTEILGTQMDFPIFVAPTGGQGPLHPDGELAMHQGATAAKTPMIVPNGTSFPIEEIAAAATGPLWFQFYPRQDLDLSREVLETAQAAGSQTVVVTIDQQATYFERDLHDRNLGRNVEADRRRYQERRRRRSEPSNPYRVRDTRLWYEWEYLDKIHPFVEVPMLAKGIMTAEDARLCLKYGLDGIIVSNHGGRSLDYAPSSLEVLPEIVDAVQGRIPVLIDSGFRRGSDILKALALGADGVCLGRTTRWGLGGFGPAGVQRVLEILQSELVQAMAQVGRSTLASLDPSIVRTDFP